MSESDAATCIKAAAKEISGELRPILAEKCYPCHTDTATSQLRVDSREALLKGGSRGPAIMPGEPDKSLLIEAVLFIQV